MGLPFIGLALGHAQVEGVGDSTALEHAAGGDGLGQAGTLPGRAARDTAHSPANAQDGFLRTGTEIRTGLGHLAA